MTIVTLTIVIDDQDAQKKIDGMYDEDESPPSPEDLVIELVREGSLADLFDSGPLQGEITATVNGFRIDPDPRMST